MPPLTLHTLSSVPGSRKQRRRVGRGNGSRGTYSGRGAKGQRSRTGGRRGIIRRSLRSLMERVPKKRGFTSRNAKDVVINISDLERLFPSASTVGPQDFKAKHLMQPTDRTVKILGNGTLKKKLTVCAHGFSSGAEKAIKSAGGSIVRLGPVPVQKKTAKPS